MDRAYKVRVSCNAPPVAPLGLDFLPVGTNESMTDTRNPDVPGSDSNHRFSCHLNFRSRTSRQLFPISKEIRRQNNLLLTYLYFKFIVVPGNASNISVQLSSIVILLSPLSLSGGTSGNY